MINKLNTIPPRKIEYLIDYNLWSWFIHKSFSWSSLRVYTIILPCRCFMTRVRKNTATTLSDCFILLAVDGHICKWPCFLLQLTLDFLNIMWHLGIILWKDFIIWWLNVVQCLDSLFCEEFWLTYASTSWPVRLYSWLASCVSASCIYHAVCHIYIFQNSFSMFFPN